MDGESGRHHVQPLYPRERSMVPSEQETGWGPEPVYMIWRREKSLAPPLIQTQY